ncbi:MAG: cation-transporting P-type ATPase [Candidatus Pacearchaeota archaeon]
MGGSTRGLTSEEARKSLRSYGFNEIKDTSQVHPLKILLRQVKSNFVIYILFFAMVLCFFVGGEKIVTGYIILGIIFIVILVGFFQEYKAEKAVFALKSMIMPVSIVLRDGIEKEISSKEIVPGDILILRNGERVPADCIVLKENDLLISEAVLTGESSGVKKFATKSEKKFKDKNVLFMGSFIIDGKCVAKVIRTGMETRFGEIAEMISETEKELPLQKKVNSIAKYMVIFGSLFAILTGIIMVIRAHSFNFEFLSEVLIMVIAVCVASFPEGFPVVLITSLASGSYRMAKKNAVVNRMSIIETLGETTVICSDKTGTITKGEMTCLKVLSDNRIYDISGTGYSRKGEILFNSKKVNVEKEKSLKNLLRTAVLCNDSKISRSEEGKTYNIMGTPTEASLLIMASKVGLFKEDIDLEREKEIPFTSERKMMTIMCSESKKKVVYAKGALEVLLPKCKYIQRDSGVFKMLNRERELIKDCNRNFTSGTLRTLAFAYKKTNGVSKEGLEDDLIFLGLVGMSDPPREEVKEAVETCRNAGIRVKMITGDNRETAISIAKQIGLDEGEVIEGEELEKITDRELVRRVMKTVIFSRVKPEHKLRIVQALKANGEVVTMTGDGVNDAPALKEAHIGVAMGRSGTDVSRSVADLTLKDDNFAAIIDAIKEGRTIFTNIQKFASYQISINFAQVAIIFLSVLLGLPLPLVAIQILFMNIFSDELTAITLAFNPYSKDVMTTKPRRKSSIVSKPLFLLIVFSGLIICLSALTVFYHTLSYMELKESMTLVFACMVFFATFNSYNFRSFRKLTINRSPFTNKFLFYASVLVLLITVFLIYSPIGSFINLTSIPYYYLIPIFLTSFLIIVVIDVVKIIGDRLNLWEENMQDFNQDFKGVK